jgi:GNAT superfamily N-acetyltransferase
MKKTVSIRPAVGRDSTAICPLLLRLGYRRTPEELGESLSVKTEASLAFVAETDGKVVGFLSLHIIDWLHRPDPAARLSAVVVDAGYRRAGIGAALVAFAEATASRRGCSAIELTSNLRRKADGTYDFYASLGYGRAEETTYFRKALGSLTP